jgi:hypothetical protein
MNYKSVPTFAVSLDATTKIVYYDFSAPAGKIKGVSLAEAAPSSCVVQKRACEFESGSTHERVQHRVH